MTMVHAVGCCDDNLVLHSSFNWFQPVSVLFTIVLTMVCVVLIQKQYRVWEPSFTPCSQLVSHPPPQPPHTPNEQVGEVWGWLTSCEHGITEPPPSMLLSMIVFHGNIISHIFARQFPRNIGIISKLGHFLSVKNLTSHIQFWHGVAPITCT